MSKRKGQREQFHPRPGHVYIQADYEGLELHTLAQVCYTLFGYSKLGDALNSGLDPHSEIGGRLISEPYASVKAGAKDKIEKYTNARGMGKVVNFGRISGLGAPKLVLYARKSYGIIVSEHDARQLIELWMGTWVEMNDYYDLNSRLCDNETGLAQIEQLFVKRWRGGCHFTAASSTRVQGLGADIAKNGMWLVSKACYVEDNSPLFGCRPVAMVHDEIIAECPVGPVEKMSAAAKELGRLMLLGAEPYLPQCPAKIEPLIMDCWSKDAKSVYDESGNLLVWRYPIGDT